MRSRQDLPRPDDRAGAGPSARGSEDGANPSDRQPWPLTGVKLSTLILRAEYSCGMSSRARRLCHYRRAAIDA
jgi:hypothetical protein